jgi:CopG family transcriptional regulator, nickel-responsive regulator
MSSSRGSNVVRLGVSLEPALLTLLDRWVRQRNSASRSDAIRTLIRKEFEDEVLLNPEADAVATLTLLYRHDQPGVMDRLAAAQHRWGEHIRFTGHIHLQGESCLEILALVGKAREVQQVAEDLRGVRGVATGAFTVSSPSVVGGRTGHRHPHPH